MATFLTAFAAFMAALGIKELLARYVLRRNDREDAARADHRAVSAVEAQGNLEVLKVLLTETKARVDSYEKQILDLKASHAADISELKTENRSLNRQVADLRMTLQDYQLGNRVPRGMVLIPVTELRAIRERQPGLLLSRWYPGEPTDEMQNMGPETNPRGHLIRLQPPSEID